MATCEDPVSSCISTSVAMGQNPPMAFSGQLVAITPTLSGTTRGYCWITAPCSHIILIMASTSVAAAASTDHHVNSMLPQPSHHAVDSKLPIPRASNPGIFTNRVHVRHTCNNCREHKAKCSGNEACQPCEDTGSKCVYRIRR